MKRKTCGECRFFESKEFICCHTGDEVAAHFIACGEFEPMTKPKPTLFDRITASPEMLAESSVYFEEEHSLVLEGSDCGAIFDGGWTSPFIEYNYGTRPEAVAATVARLKEELMRS